MWKNLEFMNRKVTSKELNLKYTLLNGQCFNFKYLEKLSLFAGTVKKSLLILREHNSFIEYRFVVKDPEITNEIDFLSSYFHLEIDIEDLIQKSGELKINNKLKQILLKYPGLRLIRQEIFECTISFICSANNNISRITKMIDSLKKEYGEKLYSDPELGDYYSFPDIVALDKLTVESLNKLGFGYRSKYLRTTIDTIKEKGTNWLDGIKTSENPSQQLEILSGVGKKVADCISLFSCGRMDIVPIDVHMFNFYNENISNFTGNYKKIQSVGSKNNYTLLQSNLREILGPYAGWLHSIFFINRLDSKSSKKAPRADPDLEEIKSKISTKKPKKV